MPEIRSWLAFALQKLDELRVLATALQRRTRRRRGRAGRQPGRAGGAPRLPAREQPAVQAAVAQHRRQPRPAQAAPTPSAPRKQAALLKLPAFPTTTIGSFPQTAEIRQARSEFKAGKLDDAGYKAAMQAEIARSVREQEALGLDVLVHGEAERNDMVEYFGEQLDGYAFSQFGWVQSYGSRCVKPPILFGDISRPRPMTVEWIQLRAIADRKTHEGHADRPGHDPQLVLRARRPAALGVVQAAGAGHPRKKCWTWKKPACASSRSTRPRCAKACRCAARSGSNTWTGPWNRSASRANGVADETQIHTHMCYSEFNDIIASIAAMDADVITIETSRSDMELLDAFEQLQVPERDRPRRLRHPLAEHPDAGTDRAPDEEGGRAHSGGAPVGQSRLRPEDPRVGRSDPGTGEYGCGSQDPARSVTLLGAQRI